MGKVKLAQVLARAGLHMAATTVGRMIREEDEPRPDPVAEEADDQPVRVVTAKRPNHVWHVDLTQMPITGLWVPWLPNALPQLWPFVWHVIAVCDHFSRACLGVAVFKRPPTSEQVTGFLDRVIAQRGKPKHMISDKGSQFDCNHYKQWADGIGVWLRFGKVGKHGSIAVIERFIRSLKDECMRKIRVPFELAEFRQELVLYVTWYNYYRPHMTLNGRTPVEVFEELKPANEKPRIEPRPKWPQESPCAAPQADVEGDPGAQPVIEVAFLEGRKHLPIVRVKTAA
jgi:transposase InsO family protein